MAINKHLTHACTLEHHCVFSLMALCAYVCVVCRGVSGWVLATHWCPRRNSPSAVVCWQSYTIQCILCACTSIVIKVMHICVQEVQTISEETTYIKGCYAYKDHFCLETPSQLCMHEAWVSITLSSHPATVCLLFCLFLTFSIKLSTV